MKDKLQARTREFLFTFAIIPVCAICCLAQQPEKSPQPVKDEPIHVVGDKTKKFDEALKPHIEEAKRTYPEAKKRFIEGLPPKDRFFITVKLRDGKCCVEQAFIEVKEITDGIVTGLITDDVTFVTKYKKGDEYSFPESDLIDWKIIKANGIVEGNFVGKFLDTYEP